MNDINLWSNDEAVCPACGHEHEREDLDFDWEDDYPSDIVIPCNQCGEEFRVSVEMNITYTTSPLIKELCSSCGDLAELYKLTLIFAGANDQEFGPICKGCSSVIKNDTMSRHGSVSYRERRLEN